MNIFYSMSNSFNTFFKKKSIRILLAFVLLLVINIFEGKGQITYTWNQIGAADWTLATNWTPNRGGILPNDILIFDNAANTTPINIPTQTIGQLLVSNGTIVNLQGGAPGTILTISGLPGVDLSVTNGSELNIKVAINTTTLFIGTGATADITGNMTFSMADHRLDAADANAINFNTPSIFIQGAGCTGNIFTNGGTANAIVFNTGTIFVQLDGANPFGLGQPLSKVVFNTGNRFIYQVPGGSPSFSGRNYADFQYSGSGAAATCVGANTVSIDKFNVTSGTINVNMTANPGHSIKGNITIAAGATLNFNPASVGTINFIGTTPQSITNAGTLTLNVNQDVNFNNVSGITLNSNITLNGLVTFTSGIVTTANPTILTLSSTASVAGVSNSSYVDGLVKKIGNTAFIFPVGKLVGATKAYVPIEISAPGSITDEYTAEYKRTSAQALSTNYAVGLDHVSGVDYWTLDRTSGATPINLTLYWTVESSANGSALYINDISKLRIAHFNSGIPQWDTYGVTATTGGFAAGSITMNGVNVFSPFSLGSLDASNPLPINLNYINGYKQGNNNYINWKVTCTNNPNATMNVERSADGRNFTGITTITADALRCQQPFDYTDNKPLADINYYRLKMTDAYGKVTYSTIIAVLNKETGFDIVGLLPTLVNSNAILSVIAAQKTKMDVLITDIAGKQVQKIAYNLIAGLNQFTLNLANLTAGTYQITGYTADGKSRTVRFVKQ